MPAKKKTARGTAAKRKKVKRTALPGGAPLKTASNGKSRSSAGSSSKKKAPKAKPPCKYGPRLANGRCPVKPKGERNRLTVSSRTVQGASKQATSVVLNPRASAQQKVEAVAKVAEAAAVETVKQTARKIITPSRIAAAKAALKKAAPLAIGISAPLAAGAAVGVARFKVAQHRAATDMTPQGKAIRALTQVEKNLKRKLTPAERRVLFKQHVEFYRKNPKAP